MRVHRHVGYMHVLGNRQRCSEIRRRKAGETVSGGGGGGGGPAATPSPPKHQKRAETHVVISLASATRPKEAGGQVAAGLALAGAGRVVLAVALRARVEGGAMEGGGLSLVGAHRGCALSPTAWLRAAGSLHVSPCSRPATPALVPASRGAQGAGCSPRACGSSEGSSWLCLWRLVGSIGRKQLPNYLV